MIEGGDDDDLRMRTVFSALRRHVARISNDFGARLGVRLLAIAAARDKSDPSMLTIFADVMSEAVTLALAPLTGADSVRDDIETNSQAPDKEDNDA